MTQRTQGSRDASVIDLGLGHPDDALLPLPQLRDAACSRLAAAEPSLLQYGVEEGDPQVREALAAFLEARGGAAPRVEELMLTAGASQALSLLCDVLLRPGDTVLVEEPTYFLALGLFRERGLRVVGVPSDAGGIDVDALAELLARERPRMLYTVPAFQNPSGATLAPERRRRLLELCRESETWLVADEVYRLLSYDAPPPASLAAPDPGANVVALGSFSKILAPGLRLGWIHASPSLIGRLAGSGLPRSGGGLNPFVAALVGHSLESGAAGRHLDLLLRSYRERAAALSEALGEAFALPPPRAQGGYFLWLRLPGRDTAALLPAARRRGVAFQPGVRFSTQDGLKEWARLSFSFYAPGALRRAAFRLAEAARGEEVPQAQA